MDVSDDLQRAFDEVRDWEMHLGRDPAHGNSREETGDRRCDRRFASGERAFDKWYRRWRLTDSVVIYDQIAYDKCRQIVGLMLMGYTPHEVDLRCGWPEGTAGRIMYDHPRLMQRAEQVVLAELPIRYKVAKARGYEVAANCIEPTVHLLYQVVAGGNEFVPDSLRSRDTRPVANEDLSPAVRIKAAEILLRFVESRFKAAEREEDKAAEAAGDTGPREKLSEEFEAKVKRARDAALNVVKMTGTGGA